MNEKKGKDYLTQLQKSMLEKGAEHVLKTLVDLIELNVKINIEVRKMDDSPQSIVKMTEELFEHGIEELKRNEENVVEEILVRLGA